MTGTLGTSLNLDVEMAIIEVGAAYEVARSGPLAFDVLGGARYWHQEADLSFDIAGAVDVSDLEAAGGRAFGWDARLDEWPCTDPRGSGVVAGDRSCCCIRAGTPGPDGISGS
ncbi:hypothetical protein VB618_08300 [Microvirga sp. CF3062]|uniref:hypothetical protein n=1 Tax=Microvirga sp. CF3062 TaxID=3110182 RepID=UPI002E773751|nr:hypothetical protein [Microvirga sp. CF3062]MEE1656195.1 hypothetical protein [Microvirga sp. CF3062]